MGSGIDAVESVLPRSRRTAWGRRQLLRMMGSRQIRVAIVLLGLLGPLAGARAAAPVGEESIGDTVDEEPDAGSRLRTSLGLQGLPGLVDIPVAASTPSGSLDVGYNFKRDFSLFPGADEQHDVLFAVGLLPRVTIGGRGTVVNQQGEDVHRDISANAHLLVLEEGDWWPSLGGGIYDIGGGSQLFESPFVVASKSFLGRVRASVGWGGGPRLLDGPFGGIEVAVCPYLTLAGEHDSRDLAALARVFPLPRSLEEYGVPRPALDFVWQEGGDLAFGVSLRINLGETRYRHAREERARRRFERPPSPEEPPPEEPQAEEPQASPPRLRDTATLPATPPFRLASIAGVFPRAGDRFSDAPGIGIAPPVSPDPEPVSPDPDAVSATQETASIATEASSPTREADGLRDALVSDGLENVRVSFSARLPGRLLIVEYENRRYGRSELDALGAVLGTVVTRAPPDVTRLRVVTRAVQIPVLQLECSPDDLLAYLNGELSDDLFASRLEITNEPDPLPADAIGSTRAAPSWLRVDAFLRPGVETLILTDISVAEGRFTFLPDAYVQLTPGLVVNVRGSIPAAQTDRFPTRLPEPAVDRVLVHQAIPLRLGGWTPHATGLAQVSAGRFTRHWVGGQCEAAATVLDGWLLLAATGSWIGESVERLDRWIALGTLAGRYPPWDTTLRVTGGRFLDQDHGVDVNLARFFGNTEIGVFLRHTDSGSVAGIRVGIPLTPGREPLGPWWVRPRLPELFSYEQRTTVFDGPNVIRTDIGRRLSTDHEIESRYWNRDRLYPAYIRNNLDAIRDAARRWTPEAKDGPNSGKE